MLLWPVFQSTAVTLVNTSAAEPICQLLPAALARVWRLKSLSSRYQPQ